MNYKVFSDVYKANCELDKMFTDTFEDIDMIKKNKLELLVEIGELANETRYFKYWSNKPIDIDLVKEEFADCMIMALSFFNVLDIDLDDSFPMINQYNKIDVFGRLYKLAIDFYYNSNQSIIKEFFVTLINLGYLIGFNNHDIVILCMNKINKNKAKFKENL